MDNATTRRGHHAIALVLALAMLVVAAAAHAQTGPLLRAPRVQSRVRLQWDPALRRIVAAVDEEAQFHPLALAPPFLTDDVVVVTYPRLNPLRIAANITSVDGPVPEDTVLAPLRALLSFATVSVPSPGASPVPFNAVGGSDSCPALTSARADVAALLARVSVTRGSPTVATLISSWRQSIDDAFGAGRSGPEAVAAAVSRIDAFVAQLDAQLGDADRILSRMEAATTAGPGQPCDESARAVYDAVSLANPRGRLAQLTAVRSAVVLVREALSRDYLATGATKWRGPEYVLDAGIRPTRQSSAIVTVRAMRLDFDIDESSGALTVVEEHAGSETLVAQRFSRFASEFAVATVLGSVTTPGYGTTTNAAGATVVGRLPRSLASVEPAFLASFVCRCRTGPLVAPMLQVGIATSNDIPALLGGGGIRLFGLPKGDVALGAGGMIAWVKTLRTLHVGDPVGGTSDIQADLHFARRNGYYLALQYKF